jgi:hypothetical protein
MGDAEPEGVRGEGDDRVRGPPPVGVRETIVRVAIVSLSVGTPQSEQKRLLSDSSPPQETHALIGIDDLTTKHIVVGAGGSESPKHDAYLLAEPQL